MTKTTILAPLAAALIFAFAASSAQAAPVDDARAHFQAVAAGDIAKVMQSYGGGAQFQWVGGPLDGAYSDPAAIRGVWSKFFSSQGPLKLSVGAIEESANPKGATVSANVLFEGKAPIKVRYVLTFREGKIVNEVWQIDPKLTIASTR